MDLSSEIAGVRLKRPLLQFRVKIALFVMNIKVFIEHDERKAYETETILWVYTP